MNETGSKLEFPKSFCGCRAGTPSQGRQGGTSLCKAPNCSMQHGKPLDCDSLPDLKFLVFQTSNGWDSFLRSCLPPQRWSLNKSGLRAAGSRWNPPAGGVEAASRVCFARSIADQMLALRLTISPAPTTATSPASNFTRLPHAAEGSDSPSRDRDHRAANAGPQSAPLTRTALGKLARVNGRR